MVGIFATGKAKNSKIYNVLDPKLEEFEKALHRLCLNLAKQIVVDGEGAKKFITINVIGARSTTMAKNVGFSIANSPLVKTAIAGEDPNWGRVIMAIGKSKVNLNLNKLLIKFGSFKIIENGQLSKTYNEEDVADYMKSEMIDIIVDLNIGKKEFTSYTMDLTKEYIDINANYRT
jgi:glutamate N-acetyltransferase/amino-acid N-acetyltransferase